MKLTTPAFFCAVGILTAMAAISSCSKTERLAGSWQAQPERLVHTSDASDAMSTVTIDFVPATDGSRGGSADFTAVIEVEQPVFGGAGQMEVDYLAGVSATASVNARYIYADGDDDDIIIDFDASSLQVKVDPAGVDYARSAVDGSPQPQLDSLAAATAERWRVILTSAVREQFARYSRMDDIEFHHSDNIMTCELGSSDITLRRVGVQD